jgi:G3E family GTPase
MHGDWPGSILRAKGLFWLATRHDVIGELSQAGGILRHGAAGYWWATVPIADWPADTENRSAIRATWEAAYGDRRQELVFIGQHLDPEAIRARLDACLLTDEEMRLGPSGWRSTLAEPVPAWLADAPE